MVAYEERSRPFYFRPNIGSASSKRLGDGSAKGDDKRHHIERFNRFIMHAIGKDGLASQKTIC